MRVWAMVLMIALWVSFAHAENNEKCIELRCFCNGYGSSYTVAPCSGNCYDVCGSSGGSSTTGQPRPARVSRVFLGLTGSQGMSASYANGRSERGESQVGSQLEVAFGRAEVGLALVFGVARDAGTAPDPATTVAPMWLVDLGVGIVVSPFAIKRGRREVRPELGIYGNNLIRTNCDRCDTDAGLGQQKAAEPDQGFMWRLRAGLDFYLWNTQGISLDVLVSFGKMGDAVDPLSSVELRPPRVMFRLAWMPVRDR